MKRTDLKGLSLGEKVDFLKSQVRDDKGSPKPRQRHNDKREADNRNPDTIPRLCLPNHPISVTPICHFITFELIFVILFFSLKCFPGLEFPFNSGLKSYTLHNSNNNILAGS